MRLLSENEVSINVTDMHAGEYRSRHALKVGEDIKMIATDTEAHRQRAQSYFAKHHVPVSVLLFKDLWRAKVEYSRPCQDEPSFAPVTNPLR